LPGYNPAHRIINNIQKNKKYNNWERLDAFTYETYNRFHINKGKADSLDLLAVNQQKPPKDSTNKNTSNQKSVTVSVGGKSKKKKNDVAQKDSTKKDFFDRMSSDSFYKTSHVFMVETVTEKRYRYPYKYQENVVATKVSGIKEPLFSMLSTQYTDYNPYQDKVTIGGSEAIGPLSYNSTKPYLFILEDSFVRGNDSVFLISFRPKNGKLFKGMIGLMYVNGKDWAIQSITARPISPDGGLDYEIIQNFEKLEGGKWFPSQILFKNVFNKMKDSSIMAGYGKAYFRDINLNPTKKESKIGIDNYVVEESSMDKSEQFWKEKRSPEFSKQDSLTYIYVDTLFKEAEKNGLKINKLIKIGKVLSQGYLKLGPLNWKLFSFLQYNGYEGFRLTPELYTNDVISKYVQLGGYVGYGFKDKAVKYGGDFVIKPVENSPFQINFTYQNDVSEVGQDQKMVLKNNTAFSNALPRLWNATHYFQTENFGLSLKIRPMKYTYLFAGIKRHEEKFRFLPYQYITENGESKPTLSIDELTLGLKYAYNEVTYKIPGMRFEEEGAAPILYLMYRQGLDQFKTDALVYQRIDLATQKTFSLARIGKMTFFLSGSYMSEKTPLTRLSSPAANYGPNNKWINSLGSFETMRPYSFFAQQTANLFVTHSFEKLLIRRKDFQPILKLHTNVGFGKYQPNIYHITELSMKGYEKGYYESGFTIDRLLTSFAGSYGFTTMYRYGPYAEKDALKNFVFKVTFWSLF
jgi:hypothetical protein